MTPEQRKAIQRTSRKQEERTAKRYNGSRNAGSGSFWSRKNDVRTERFQIENKFTGNLKSYSIKAVDLRELERDAIQNDRMPVLQFDLGGRRYVILVEDDFLEVIGAEEG